MDDIHLLHPTEHVRETKKEAAIIKYASGENGVHSEYAKEERGKSGEGFGTEGRLKK